MKNYVILGEGMGDFAAMLTGFSEEIFEIDYALCGSDKEWIISGKSPNKAKVRKFVEDATLEDTAAVIECKLEKYRISMDYDILKNPFIVIKGYKEILKHLRNSEISQKSSATDKSEK